MSDESSGEPSGFDADADADGHHDADQDADRDADEASAIDGASQALRDAQARLAAVPAERVVANHVVGLYELGAIHLSADPPDLRGAALAIDAVACLVEGLGARLGDDAPTMRDALANIRLAFVQVKGAAGAQRGPDEG